MGVKITTKENGIAHDRAQEATSSLAQKAHIMGPIKPREE